MRKLFFLLLLTMPLFGQVKQYQIKRDSTQWIDSTFLAQTDTNTVFRTEINSKLNTTDFGSTFDVNFALKSTSDLAEGANLYYTNARVNTVLSTFTGTSNIVTVGALNSGSITSAFGNIDIGTSSLTSGNSIINGTLTQTSNSENVRALNISGLGTVGAQFIALGIANTVAATLGASNDIGFLMNHSGGNTVSAGAFGVMPEGTWSSTSTTRSSCFAFKPLRQGAQIERMRLTSLGELMLNKTVSSGELLQVNGTTLLDGDTQITGELTTSISIIDVSNPPTDAELDSAFGAPSSVGSGWQVFINDNNLGLNFYKVVSDGLNWWIFTGVKAL